MLSRTSSIHPSPCTGNILSQPARPQQRTATICRTHRTKNFCMLWLALSMFWVLPVQTLPKHGWQNLPSSLAKHHCDTRRVCCSLSDLHSPNSTPRSEMLHHRLLPALQRALLRAQVSTHLRVQFIQGQDSLESGLQYFVQEILWGEKKRVQFQMWICFQFSVALDIKFCCHLCKQFSNTGGHNCCRRMRAQKPRWHHLLKKASLHCLILHFHRLPFNLPAVVV